MLKSLTFVDNSPYVFGYMVNNGLSLGYKTKKKMIKASELRIGNLLEFSNGIEPAKIVMVGRRFFSSAAIEKEDGDFNVTPYYRGIPLTEEWLIRFGFKKKEEEYGMHYEHKFCWAYLFGDGFEIEMIVTGGRFNLFKTFQYVHQLQNVIFALTGKELILDNNSTSSTLPDSTSAK